MSNENTVPTIVVGTQEKTCSDLVQRPLDKETVNRLIISLRPCLAQAKVHLIHNLSRQVESLKKKKCANEQEKEKNERKFSRFIEEISILKRSKRDVISKWLIVNDKSFDEVTKQEAITQKFNLKVRAFVRAGEHKSVKKVMDSFRSQYPTWNKDVQTLLRNLGKKRKKQDPNKVELGIKPVASKVGVSEEIADKKKPSKKDTIEDSSVVASEKLEEDSLESESESDSDAEIEGDFIDLKSPSLEKISFHTNSDPNLEKNCGDVLVKVLDLNNIEENTASKVQPAIKASDAFEAKRSSFFKGGESDQEECESDDEVEDTYDTADDIIQQRQEDLKVKFKGREKVGSELKQQRKFSKPLKHHEQFNGKSSFKKHNEYQPRNVQNRNKRYENSTRNSFKQHEDKFEGNHLKNNESNLHPSWAAKKRANTSIAKFEGKKIKFGDEQRPKQIGLQDKSDKPIIKSESVHPSWAAKQNLKSTIQAFQGKKVIFDD